MASLIADYSTSPPPGGFRWRSSLDLRGLPFDPRLEMTPSEPCTACIKLLAHIDQQIAECENLASQPVLADDEQEHPAVQLTLRHRWREWVKKMLAKLSSA